MSEKHQHTEMLVAKYLEHYVGKIFYFCLKRVGNDHEAENLTQDISINIIAQLKKGVIPTRFSAWVWRIARNRYSAWAINKYKQNESVSGADIYDFEIADERCIENELIHSEEVKLLRRELAFISSDYRDIVVSYYIDDFSVKDIAISLGLPEGTVKSKLFRSRKILREGMNMAREFGIKSYKPEEVRFAASGSQPSGLPWSAVERKIPKNILLAASNNPSTVEELSIELGVAVPYMEEEVELLVNATLLKKTRDKYITDFFIADKECQLEMYLAQKKGSKERSEMIDNIISDSMDKFTALGIVRNGMSENDLKWWLVIYTIDYCIESLNAYKIDWPEKRANGETWGFVGYEKTVLPENCVIGHNGSGNNSCMFWAYKISDYNLWNRAGEMGYNETILLCDIIKKGRNLSSMTVAEKETWKHIDGRFAHVDADGTIIPDILVIDNTALDKIHNIINSHSLYELVMKNIQKAFEETVEILKVNSNKVLHNQLTYCASMQILDIRMMTVHDEVESKKLYVPSNPNNSTIAMCLMLKQ